jgi:adenylate kinase family enzyme
LALAHRRHNSVIVPRLISLTHDLPSSLVLSLPLKNRYPRGFSVYPAASEPAVFALAGNPVHLADSQSARFSLGDMKVLVFGNSGSGKSTYARALAAKECIPHLDLDSIVWEPGKIAGQRPSESVAASLRSFIDSHPAWVIEGCYGELVRAASAHCTQLVFLNPGIDACLANNLRRPWEPHKYASLELQNTMLSLLQGWVAGYYQRKDAWSYHVHREIFDAFTGPKVEHREVGAYAA